MPLRSDFNNTFSTQIISIFLDFAPKSLYNIINNVIDNDEGDDMVDVKCLLKQAISETKNLEVGESFLVKDLFKGYVWNRIPRNTRLLLGTLFLNVANTDYTLKIKVVEKTSSNQQKYKKQ